MIGILYAMHKELASPFAPTGPVTLVGGMEFYSPRPGLTVCICGVGKVNAAVGTQLLIDHFHAQAVYNLGVAGCFYDDPVGSLVVGSSCVQHDMDISATGSPPGEIPPMNQIYLPCQGWEEDVERLSRGGLDCRPGVIASGDWFGRDYDRAAWVRDTFDARVCDMEAGAAAQVCLRNQIPFHSLKVVSDHLFHPSQGEEYTRNVPTVVGRVNQALSLLLEEVHP